MILLRRGYGGQVGDFGFLIWGEEMGFMVWGFCLFLL